METWLLEDAAESAPMGRSRAWLVSDRIRHDVAARHRRVVAGLGVLEAERRWVAAVLDRAAVYVLNSTQTEVFGQASWPPLSSPADQQG